MNMERRIDKAEKKLSLDRELAVVQIALFVDGLLPLDERHGNVMIRYVNYTEACKAGRVSRDTLHRWLENPAFKAELDRQRDELVAQGFALLSQSVAKAVETLVGLLRRGRPLEATGRQRHPRSAHEIQGTARTRKADRSD